MWWEDMSPRYHILAPVMDPRLSNAVGAIPYHTHTILNRASNAVHTLPAFGYSYSEY